MIEYNLDGIANYQEPSSNSSMSSGSGNYEASSNASEDSVVEKLRTLAKERNI